MMRDKRGEEDDAQPADKRKKKKKRGGSATEQRPPRVNRCAGSHETCFFVLPVRELGEAGESARAKTERERASRRNRAADSDTYIYINRHLTEGG